MERIQVHSSAFGPNQPIPRKHTADGLNVSPPLTWNAVPAGAQELVMIVDDPDAPRPQPWVHWLIYNMPATVTRLPEGVPPSQRVPDPPGAVQGKNSWGKIGYGGPEPPRGHGVHHYHFKIYALDTRLNLPPGLEKEQLLASMQGHVLAEGELVGTYER
ncbi:MAG TPA: YbhB/YbcL family Raf kinase inhibitor-like protein [Phycisphaerae bacterium]|nr:YbhB/YbcL family Raf kinase inhibitor-like protein [Phycisphaerae bacterium]HOJ72946.1 YbhB/YbcL family Raf kinase inhibitor-like protein [Phycisphaerae bacterium]HOM50130.1 YbhB/YbcL family Raf kinase inhibitor-like protein [Phycisphaerae bacterium]HON66054.1 YbhB/YbcL family Raf kinase inhibitor-like protein [Phycisphaerae bacterium]HOQ84351.1 YbhB/YbcL family Raf kinase inhibitor-like protein [Phycisphaerae bacterium]